MGLGYRQVERFFHLKETEGWLVGVMVPLVQQQPQFVVLVVEVVAVVVIAVDCFPKILGEAMVMVLLRLHGAWWERVMVRWMMLMMT